MAASCAHPVRSLRDADARDLLVRGAKVRTLAALRLARWALRPAEYPAPLLAAPPEEFPEPVYERIHPLTRPEHRFHALLEEGKRVNLSLAAPAFDGLLVTPDRPLSFWRVLGRLTPARGYVLGASFADGCVIPAVGGGVCLLSNALFAMAARLGWRILERHGHSLDAAPPPAGDPWGLDATVLWPYVDLRVAPREGQARLEVRVRDGGLTLRVRSTVPLVHAFALEAVDDRTTPRGPDESLRENRIRRICAREGEAPVTEVIAVNRKRVRPRPSDGQSCLDCGVDCLVGRRARAEAGVE
jgi:vancomycin resistance protein VanW